MTPERLQTLNSQKHNLYTEFLPRGPNFTLFHYTTSRFRDKGCRNLEMPRMAPEWPFKHFTVKRVMNTLKIHPKTQISLFHSTTLVENRKCTEWPQNDLKHVTVKSFCIYWILTTEAQISLCFAIRPAVFKIQGWWQSEMHRMTPTWPQALNF